MLLRQIEMLRMIPRNKMVTTSKIKARLETLGYVITERTIQRDLNELSRKFPIICDDTKKPYQWSMTDDSHDLDIPSLGSDVICSQLASTEAPEIQRRLDDIATRPKTIFFSYGHDDGKELVQLFKQDLEKRGHQIWFDEKDIGNWDDWKGKITQGIDSSHMAVAFISKHSIRDPGVCRNEIAIAMNRFGTVYPILIEDGIEQDIPVTIQHLQWPDLSRWKDIRNGKVPDIEWGRWYEEKLLSLIEKIEGDATRFSDETRVLQQVLQPTTSESKIAQHVPGFVGREWIFDAYSQWVDHQPESRLFWIKAGPGVGKTAIAANLTNSKRDAICASWFCDAKSSERRNPNTALKTLAFQLALRWEDYRVRLLRSLQLYASATDVTCDNVREELGKKNTQDLFLLLLADPMTGLIWRGHKLVVVIDALDEATDEQGNNQITELISRELDSLPGWIGFVVTSRPEAKIVNRLRRFKPFEMNAEDPRNLNDLRDWYKKKLGKRPELNELCESEQHRIEDLLIERSEGMILYLKMVEEGFKEGSLCVSKLEGMGSGLPGLFDRYYDSFQTRFGEDYEISVKPLLRLLLAAGGPLPEDLVNETLKWNSEQFLTCRNRLGSYVIETDQGYELFHRTLAEWLGDKSSAPFYVDRSLGRQILADVLFKEMVDKENHLVQWRLHISEWLPDWLPELSQQDNPSAIGNLGQKLQYWASYSKALPLLELALEMQEKILGPEHLDTATALNNLAGLLRDQGKHAEAESLLLRALGICEKILGTEHPNTTSSLHNLAGLLRDQGKHAEAEPLYRRALAIREKILGAEHIDVASSLNGLAALFNEQGNYTEAEPLYRRALAIREKILGAEHIDVASSLNGISILLRNQGKLAEAELLCRRALAIREKILGAEHPYTASSLNNLASLLRDQGKYAEAEPLYQHSLEIWKKTLGAEHPDVATSLNNLAMLLCDQDKFAEAEPLYNRALAIWERTLGAEHPNAATSLNGLAGLFHDQGKYAEAELLYHRALVVREKTLGSEHPYVATSINNLASLLRDQGRYEEAQLFYQRALDIYEKSLGTAHPYTKQAQLDYDKFIAIKG